MGTQEITLVVIGSVLALIYLASKVLEKDCQRLEAEQTQKA